MTIHTHSHGNERAAGNKLGISVLLNIECRGQESNHPPCDWSLMVVEMESCKHGEVCLEPKTALFATETMSFNNLSAMLTSWFGHKNQRKVTYWKEKPTLSVSVKFWGHSVEPEQLQCTLALIFFRSQQLHRMNGTLSLQEIVQSLL